MTERVERLRRQSLNALPALSHERALLMTAFAKESEHLTPPLRRAHAFRTLMESQTVCLNDGELIVGERGPAPKATSTYPELCCHSMEDLALLHSRERIRYDVSATTAAIYRDEIIPYWKGKTIREAIFAAMTAEWKDAYAAGLFTEFMEQRAPGHTVLDGKLYAKGLLGLRRDAATALAGLERSEDPEGERRRDELRAMIICADALITLAGRYAAAADEAARREGDPVRRSELEDIGRVCRWVPAHPPATFQ